jgi:hypothetical protein
MSVGSIMQFLSETLYTVSAEFNVGIFGQENKRVQTMQVGDCE